jgi:DNA-binding transcriptional LysR family regulator
MDLRDIEYFAVVAEHGHVGRAAEALGLGQPALSMSLRRLEKSAQAKLVRRTPKGVELTAVGVALLSHVRHLRLARDDLAREVADLAHGRAGHLRIGAGPATGESFLPEACSALLKDTPKVTLNVAVSSTQSVLQALRKGELDIVVSHVWKVPSHDLNHELLWNDEFVVSASNNHPLAKRKSLTLDDLVQERWAITGADTHTSGQLLHRTFEDRGLPSPQITLVSDSLLLRRRTVASCNLLDFASKQTVRAAARSLRLVVLPVKGMKCIAPIAVFYRREAYLSPAARRFIEILKAAAKEITAETK